MVRTEYTHHFHTLPLYNQSSTRDACLTPFSTRNAHRNEGIEALKQPLSHSRRSSHVDAFHASRPYTHLRCRAESKGPYLSLIAPANNDSRLIYVLKKRCIHRWKFCCKLVKRLLQLTQRSDTYHPHHCVTVSSTGTGFGPGTKIPGTSGTTTSGSSPITSVDNLGNLAPTYTLENAAR